MQVIRQFSQRDEATMKYEADSVDGSENPTGKAEQQYGDPSTLREDRTHEGASTGQAEQSGPVAYDAGKPRKQERKVAKVVNAPKSDEKPSGSRQASKE